jgi:alpha-glucosidase (family GH31 glycosyl hydrolase)
LTRSVPGANLLRRAENSVWISYPSQGATSRDVYLPAGDDWYDWWTNERHTGGTTITRPVDLATMPIFARAGAAMPFDPVRQYMDEPVDEPTTIKVFTGEDGTFTMYEDDGISLDYLEDRATWTRFTWNNATRRLTLEPAPPPGATNLPAAERTFVVELVPSGETRTVRYRGARTEVGF